MTETLKLSLWRHFGASIDMLGNAIAAWPDEHWFTRKQFFYNAYHCLVFLDYYLTVPPENFVAPLPFTLTKQELIPEDAIDDVVPDRIYEKGELLNYQQLCREKCRVLIAGLTAEQFTRPWIDGPGPMYLDLCSAAALHCSVLDILLYNLKHVQHHTAQLNLLLRQVTGKAPDYISLAEDSLY